MSKSMGEIAGLGQSGIYSNETLNFFEGNKFIFQMPHMP